MKIHVWPENGRVMYLNDAGVLKKVVPAIGTVLPSYSLQVLAWAAESNGVVAPSAFEGVQ